MTLILEQIEMFTNVYTQKSIIFNILIWAETFFLFTQILIILLISFVQLQTFNVFQKLFQQFVHLALL